MNSLLLASLSPFAVILLVLLRVPVAAALGIVSATGLAIVRGPEVAFSMLGTVPFEFAANWTLSAVPMFLLMGAIAYRAELTRSLFDASKILLARVPGGLAVASNMAAAVFAAASGSSVATTAAMGRLAIPDMLRSGYSPSLATACVAASGTLGALIPPSVVLIIYGWYTQLPIAKLLIAGLLPGVLTAVVFGMFIIGYASFRPAVAPRLKQEWTRADRRRIFSRAWPVPVLILAIIGSIYTGFATATEAGALGSLVAALLAAVRGRLTLSVLRDSASDALKSTVSIFLIAASAVLYTRFLAFCELPEYLVSLIGAADPDPTTIILFMVGTYIVLGMFLEPIGIMLITLPILVPLFQETGLDLIWMGILVVKLLEIGLLTPPIGLNVYVVKSVIADDVALHAIFKGTGWFVALDLLVIVLLVAFPQIALYLPSLM